MIANNCRSLAELDGVPAIVRAQIMLIVDVLVHEGCSYASNPKIYSAGKSIEEHDTPFPASVFHWAFLEVMAD